jgi:hypothetical protein
MTEAQLYAALILRHLRTGAYDTAPGTVLAKEAEAIGGGFARLRSWARLFSEDLGPLSGSPGQALLPDWEAAVAQSARGAAAARKTAVVGRLRDWSTPTAAELAAVLGAILGYEPTIHELKAADLPPERADAIFQFVVELTQAWPGRRVLDRVQAKIDALKPAHTGYRVTDAMVWVVNQGTVGRTVI